MCAGQPQLRHCTGLCAVRARQQRRPLPPAGSLGSSVSAVGELVHLPGVSGRRSTLRPAERVPQCTLGSGQLVVGEHLFRVVIYLACRCTRPTAVPAVHGRVGEARRRLCAAGARREGISAALEAAWGGDSAPACCVRCGTTRADGAPERRGHDLRPYGPAGRACDLRRIVSRCGRCLEPAVAAVRPGRRLKDRPRPQDSDAAGTAFVHRRLPPACLCAPLVGGGVSR